jgi:hypothetical protein
MNRKWIISACLVLSQSFFWSLASAQAAWAPYDWTVTIKTERLDNQFDYSGSTLKPVVKGTVSYGRVSDTTAGVKYEELWFCRGKPYGLERKGPLAIPQGDGVAIRVIHIDDHGIIDNHATPDELAAAADSILRVVVDAQVNQNIVHTIIVPAQSFSGICQSLQKQHFVVCADAVETPHLAGAYLFLVDDADKQRQSLRYSP